MGRKLLLSCTAKGDLMVIFKRKTEPKLKVLPGFLVTANEKGWMSKVLMTRYIKEIWMKQVIIDDGLLLWTSNKLGKIISTLTQSYACNNTREMYFQTTVSGYILQQPIQAVPEKMLEHLDS